MSDDTPVGEAKKYMLIGQTAFEIADPLVVDVVFADIFTELRVNDGVLSLSLAASVVDAENKPELRIVSRLRMPLTTFANIQASIERQAEKAAKAREAAN